MTTKTKALFVSQKPSSSMAAVKAFTLLSSTIPPCPKILISPLRASPSSGFYFYFLLFFLMLIVLKDIYLIIKLDYATKELNFLCGTLAL
jgi:hypothetical protein